jgi:hypothetical protein
MEVVPNQPAVLAASDGKTTNCETVFVGTGGHRLAPGFQTRGFTTGDVEAPTTQPLYVECEGVEAAPGSILTIKYDSFQGELDDYDPEANQTDGVEPNLDDVVTDAHPVATPVEGLLKTRTDQSLSVMPSHCWMPNARTPFAVHLEISTRLNFR